MSVPDQKPPSGWPANGMIQFDHMNLKYSPTDLPVLNDLNFTILPAQKVCRCMNDLLSQ
jgi:ABC-type multidrug transport system fused ATPase/permease subunit